MMVVTAVRRCEARIRMKESPIFTIKIPASPYHYQHQHGSGIVADTKTFSGLCHTFHLSTLV